MQSMKSRCIPIVAMLAAALMGHAAAASEEISAVTTNVYGFENIPVEILDQMFPEGYILDPEIIPVTYTLDPEALDPQPMHDYCYQGQNEAGEHYCCKHQSNGHHICQWYKKWCGWSKVGDTFYYGCMWKPTGKDKVEFCAY
jgi:hypothetical protein